MADGFKGVVSQVATDVGEAVVKPVSDEVGRAIEQGIQSVAGTTPKPLDPLEQQKKQAEAQKTRNRAIGVIDWYKQIDEAQKKVRQDAQQKVMQQKQQEEEGKKVKQFQEMEQQRQDQQIIAVKNAQTRTEAKKGVGG